MDTATLNQQYAPLHATIMCAVEWWAKQADILLWPEAGRANILSTPAAVDEFTRVVEKTLVQNFRHNRRNLQGFGNAPTSEEARTMEHANKIGSVAQFLAMCFPWQWSEILVAQTFLIGVVVDAVIERYPPHRDSHAWECLLEWYGATATMGR